MSPPTETIPELIVSYAKNHQVDLIVIGSRGLKGLKKILLGSVSEEVSQKASCQVLIVK
jgi:nucleotide-binding universal stress UspA family protein